MSIFRAFLGAVILVLFASGLGSEEPRCLYVSGASPRGEWLAPNQALNPGVYVGLSRDMSDFGHLEVGFYGTRYLGDKVRISTSAAGGEVALTDINGGWMIVQPGTTVEWLADALPLTFGIQGWYRSSAPRDVVIHVEYVSSGPVDPVDLRVTVVQVSEVNWVGVVAGDGKTNLSPDNPESHGGGWRLFPDANEFDGDSHDQVDCQATVSFPVPSPNVIPVYLQAFDVDDPTQDYFNYTYSSNPADSDDTSTQWFGGDNRGGTPGISPDGIVTRTVGGGQDTVVCRYSIPDYAMCPGNNFKILVTTDKVSQDGAIVNYQVQNGLDSVNSFGEMGNPGGPPRDCSSSPLLSLWRKLHVELDSMGPPFDTGTSTNLTDTTLSDCTQNWDVDQFASYAEAWTLRPNTNQNMDFAVEDHGDNSIFVGSSGGLLAVAQQGDPYKVSFVGWGDDDLLTTDDLPQPDTSALEYAFRQAYIQVFFDTGNDDSHMPWHANFRGAGITLGRDEVEEEFLRRHRNTNTSDFYWAAHVATLYECLDEQRDNDPDEEIACQGRSYLEKPKVAAVYEEVMRDVGAQWSFGTGPIKPLVVLHEIGHMFGLQHSIYYTDCMWVPGDDVEESEMPYVAWVFKVEDIHLIRSFVSSP